jgi:uncharacterized membrane protein SirB2
MADAQQQIPWILSKTGVLVMLFLVLGPFGLPFLYKSPVFTKGQKGFWTAMVLLYTVIGIAVIIVAAIYIWRLLLPLFNIQ